MDVRMRNIVCFLLFFLPLSTWAMTYDPNTHVPYSGDYNGDGRIDIILKAVPQMNIVYMGAYAIPFEFEIESIVFLNQTDGSYQALFSADKHIISGLALTTRHQAFYVDLNGDNRLDLALQGLTASDASVYTYGGDAANDVMHITEQQLGIAPHAGSVLWIFSDLNGDGSQDLELRSGGTTQAIAYGGTEGELNVHQYDEDHQPAAPGVLVGTLTGTATVTPSGASSY